MCGVQGCKGKGWVFRMGLAARPVMPLRAVGSRADADDGKVVLESTSSPCVVGTLGRTGIGTLGRMRGALGCVLERVRACVCVRSTQCASAGNPTSGIARVPPSTPRAGRPIGES